MLFNPNGRLKMIVLLCLNHFPKSKVRQTLAKLILFPAQYGKAYFTVDMPGRTVANPPQNFTRSWKRLPSKRHD